MFGDQGEIDVQQGRLGLIGVGHHSADDIVRGTRSVGESGRNQTRGAGFRSRDPAPREQPCHLIVHRRAVLGEDRRAVAQSHQHHQIGVRRGVRRLVAGHHLHFTPAQAGGDLEAVEPGDFALGRAQGVGQSGLGQAEHPDGVLPVDRAAGDGRRDGVGGDRRRPHGLQFPWRSGQHHDGGMAADHRARRGTDRFQDRGARRHHRLLAVRFLNRADVGVGEPCHPTVHDGGDPGLHRLIEHQLVAAEPGDGRHGHVVGGGPESAGRDDQIDALGP